MIWYLTNADTELLALRTIVEELPEGFPPVRAANPCATAASAGAGAPGPVPAGPTGTDATGLDPTAIDLDGAAAVLVRLLGGRQAWPGLDRLVDRCAERSIPLLVFGGEAMPDAELTARSSVAPGIVAQTFAYLAEGGATNLEHALRFVADTVLFRGFGFEPPEEIPATTVWRATTRRGDDTGRPLVGIVFYRAHVVAGNTQFVDDLVAALGAAGSDAVAVATYSLRPDGDGRVPALDLLAEHGVDAVITTVLAMGETDGDSWSVPHLEALGVPVVQAITATRPSADWEAAEGGLAPIDVAMSVAIPEFDGRIVSVPFSFKELVDDGDELGAPVHAYRTVADRTARVAELATRLARLRRTPVADRRVAIVLSAYPTKRARLGNAVGLDTPASALALLAHLAHLGHHVADVPDTPDELMAALADALTYDEATLTAAQRACAVGGMAPDRYADFFATVPEGAAARITEAWGQPPGAVHRDGPDGRLLFSGLELGNVLVAIQPPRGFGDNPVAVYHDPALPPTHHYLAFYRWLDEVWGADALVHLGKHGTLEWLPGKGVGLSAACAPDLALGSVPLVYPFVVNDPGEGTQAKRRAHAVIVDHLVPPMTRAGVHDDLARLEALLDEHARIAALDPAKLPAVRRQVWDQLVEAEIHRDLGWDDLGWDDVDPDAEASPFVDDAFDDRLLHVDGYLCELKDAQIRGGLHVLGQPPDSEALVDLVLAITRLRQGHVPSLRDTVAAELGVATETTDRAGAVVADRGGVDAVDAECRRRIEGLAAGGWHVDTAGSDPTLRWVCERLVPALRRTPDELTAVAGALDGRYVPSGPSGAPTRGMAHVLPTGRNFYAVDPKAVPSPLSMDVGVALADRLVERHQRESGEVPPVVGLVLWGTAAMRTMGDDVAMALALLGVRPRWDADSGRVTGLELVPEAELGRPRIDVTLRISGFFRDAFPHVVALLDEAVELAGFDGDPRIFGPGPGSYGSGILALLESGDWRSDADLAAVYEAWGGFAYGRGRHGEPARDAMRRRFAAISVAVKNQDNREHDIFDSDDYLQDHGGMVAMTRHLTGVAPRAWFGDTADPDRPRVRALAEEAARVVRSRVLNPTWIEAMQRHGYKGAFEMAATVDYLFGYDATAHIVEDWMYERVTDAYVADPEVRKFFERSNPWALRQIAERLLEAAARDLWHEPTDAATATLRAAILEAEGWEERR